MKVKRGATALLCFVLASGNLMYSESLSEKFKKAKNQVVKEFKDKTEQEKKKDSSQKQEQKESDASKTQQKQSNKTADAKQQKKPANTKAAKLEALKRKALDAYEFPEQMVARYEEKKGTKILSALTPVDAFYVNKIGLDQDDINLLMEWASAPERGENGYDFEDFRTSETRLPMKLCNALSELCGLTPVYWELYDDGTLHPVRVNSKYYNAKLAHYFTGGSGALYHYTSKIVSPVIDTSRYSNHVVIMETGGFSSPTVDELNIIEVSGKLKGASGGFCIRKQGSINSNAGEQ
ncbi:MAG: hypothetical protein IJ828_10650 [Treponema sp.]|nr:hypothetical protein [Treponema sp.]